MGDEERALGTLRAAHGRLVHDRRVRALAEAIAPLLPGGSTVADVGCGDGRLGRLLADRDATLAISGWDTLIRDGALLDVKSFDGRTLPLDDRSIDVVLLVDVIHHADDPRALLAEAARVARRALVIKDHRLSRPLASPTLALMDWVGNRAHGVALRYEYWSENRWREEWARLGLTVDSWRTELGLYPFPASLLFERGLHFVARLAR